MSRIIKKAKMKRRIFIVAPQYDGDILHKVCATTSRLPFLEVYWQDNYEELEDFDNLTDAKNYARLEGYARVKII